MIKPWSNSKVAIYMRAWRAKNRERDRNYGRKRRKLHSKEISKYNSMWYKKNHARILKQRLKYKLFCLYCSKSFMGFRNTQKYCSHKCKGNFFRHGADKQYLESNGRVVHRIIMEQHLGRKLKKIERVHHIDGNKRNNHISNLMLFKNESEHQKHHQKLIREKIDNNTRFKRAITS